MEDLQLTDLLDDASFRNWVFKSQPDDVAKWDEWINQHPSRAILAAEAAELIRSIGNPLAQLPDEQLQRNWNRLQHSIGRQRAEQAEKERRASRWLRNPYMLVAASLTLLLSLAYAWVWPAYRSVQVYTVPGQISEITLPDGTLLTLNANSSLTYYRNLPWQEWSREVWMQGEGFFDVTTTPDKARFLVHAGDMTIEVLGTRFNVRNRATVQDVVLEEGKIKLRSEAVAHRTDTLTLVPGDRVRVAETGTLVRENQVAVASVASWRDRLIVWEGLTVAEAIQRVEDAYGIAVTISDTRVLNETLQGRIPVGDVEMVLSVFAELFNAELQRNGDTILIRLREPE